MGKFTEVELRRLRHWVNEGKHLPVWLRDFHDQKDVFKACEEKMGKAANGVTWVDGQIYTIDKFLRFMALHGYTLRRTRVAPSILDTCKECTNRQQSAFAAMINATRAPKEGGGG
jgi:hypothetical protein